jgi:predicted nucleotide-binding protein (sugar kinase/HSP70/actin superfamily)
MLFKKIIAVYSENHAKHDIQNAELLIYNACGTCRYGWDLNG